MSPEPSQSRRIELILRQIDTLPTLPSVAVRLLSLTAADDVDAHQVIEVVSSDQALTAKVLAMCRRADLGLRHNVMTIEKAVVLLGFNAIRNAALSIKVLEIFQEPDGSSAGSESDQPAGSETVSRWDHAGFWRHSLAVAITAEMLASAHPEQPGLVPSEAFVCGLLHDIGKAALEHVLPKSYARVVELVELNHSNIAEFERRIIGIDHHTAGKRLAEQWQLPHRLQDCIWLHGSSLDTLPRLEHRRLIGLVSLADAIARQQHIGYSGNFNFGQEPAAMAAELGLDPSTVEHATSCLHDEIERRARLLGLDTKPSRELLLQSIQAANQALGRLNSTLERRTTTTARQTQVLEAITAFHTGAAPGRNVQDLLGAVVQSAGSVLGTGFYGMLVQPAAGEAWLVCQFSQEGRCVRSQFVEAPPNVPDLSTLDPREPMALTLMGILPWVADYLLESQDVRQIQLLPLACGWGTAAVMLHDRPSLPPWRELGALTSTWGAAIAAANQHEGARRLGEELADANRALAEAQDRLLRSESMTRVGEMAAGAAHEMNNPLAVISGRSQLLAMTLPPGSAEQKAAQTIVDQAHRLSDLITSLRMFADPPRANRQPTDIVMLLDDLIKQVCADQGKSGSVPNVALKVRRPMPPVAIDGPQIRQAVWELVTNAVQASPKTGVHVSAMIEPVEKKLVIQVTDDGVGMDAHTLAHAMDPFFSAKPAGRRVGMGLPRAQQLAAAHGGQIELRSAAGSGTTATLSVPLDSRS